MNTNIGTNSIIINLAFISLLDNYESDTGEPEIVTPEEELENHKFLDSVLKTPTMKVTKSSNKLFTTVFFLKEKILAALMNE